MKEIDNMKTEVNGPANIIMLLDVALENGQISKSAYDILIPHAENTIKYIRLLDNTKDVKWSDVVMSK